MRAVEKLQLGLDLEPPEVLEAVMLRDKLRWILTHKVVKSDQAEGMQYEIDMISHGLRTEARKDHVQQLLGRQSILRAKLQKNHLSETQREAFQAELKDVNQALAEFNLPFSHYHQPQIESV